MSTENNDSASVLNSNNLQNNTKYDNTAVTNFDDYDLFEEFEYKRNHFNETPDDELDFTRWQEDYEDDINDEDFESVLTNEFKKKNIIVN